MKKSTNFDIMTYKNVDYDVRYCIDPERKYEDMIIVGTESLEKALCDDDGDPVDDEAVKIDEKIYCYVPDETLKSSTDEDFQKYIDRKFRDYDSPMGDEKYMVMTKGKTYFNRLLQLEISYREESNLVQVCIYDPNNNEPYHVRTYPFSPDEHPEFNEELGDLLYSLIPVRHRTKH